MHRRLDDAYEPLGTTAAQKKHVLGQAVPYIVTTVVLGFVYARTLLPSTGNSSDTSKFGYLGVVLGTAHPPGYPLFTILDALWVRIVPFGEPAWRVNVLAAVFGVATCLILQRVLRLLGVGAVLATAGAILVGLTREFWTQSVVAEVYTFNAFLIALTLLGVVAYERSRHERWLVAAGIVYVLSFAHHTSAILLLPGLLAYAVWRRATFLVKPMNVGLYALSGLVVLGSYGYIVWRTAIPQTPYLESRIDDIDSFVATVTGSQFGGKMFAVPRDALLDERLPMTRDLLTAQVGWLIPLTVYGLVLLARRHPPVALVTGLWAVIEGVFAVTYRVGDWRTFLVPTWMLVALWTAYGMHGFVRVLWPQGSRATVLAFAACVPVGLAVANYGIVDQSENHSAERVRAGIQSAPDGSVIFVGSYPQWHQFNYVLLGEGVLRDRGVFAVKGRKYGTELDEQAVIIEDYCAAEGQTWDLPRVESAVMPSLDTGLATYVFGNSYASDVAANGFDLTPIGSQLHRLECR
jgi:hypothetical protein